MTEQLEKCANCLQAIGRLETSFVWKGQAVCNACHTRLSQAEAAQVARVLAYAAPTKPSKNDIACPNVNCGYCGPGLRKHKGSIIIAILLLLAGIIPGLLYAALTNGVDVLCPKCGMKIRDE